MLVLCWEDPRRWKWHPTPVFLPRIPRTEEPGRLQSMGSQRVGRNWVIKQQQIIHGNIFHYLIEDCFCTGEDWASSANSISKALTPTYLTLAFPLASLVAQTGKRLPAMWDTRVRSLGWEDPLEKEMAAHSSTLAWKIPWTERLLRAW